MVLIREIGHDREDRSDTSSDEIDEINNGNRDLDELFDRVNKHDMVQCTYCERLCKFIMENDTSLGNKHEFLGWIIDHQQQAETFALQYVKIYVKNKKNVIRTWRNYARLHGRAFARIGIDIEHHREYLRLFRDDQTIQQKVRQQVENEEAVQNKFDDIELLSSMYDTILRKCWSWDGSEFREVIHQTLVEHKDTDTIAKETIKILKALSRPERPRKKTGKSNDLVFGLALKISAYISLATQLGLRSNNILAARVDKFEILENDLLIRYSNKKNGCRSGSSRLSYTRVVFHRQAELCCIVRLSLFVFYVTVVLGEDIDVPFAFGHPCNGDSYRNVENSRKHITTLLLCVLNGAGIRLKSKKRLHLFRGLCSKNLCEAGCNQKQREDHLGWSNSTEKSHYLSAKSVAKNSITAYKLAGRENADDPAHPMYTYVSRVPEELIPDQMKEHPTLQFFARVAITTMAAGFAPEPFMEFVVGFCEQPVFKPFQKDLQVFIWSKANDPTKKRSIEDLEIENVQLKKQLDEIAQITKQRRISKIYNKEDLEHAIKQTLKDAKDEQFPEQLQDLFTDFVPILDQIASNSAGFGINLSSGVGKSFAKMLRLLAFVCRHGTKNHLFTQRKPNTSWLGFVTQNNAIFSALPSLNSWEEFKQTYKI